MTDPVIRNAQVSTQFLNKATLHELRPGKSIPEAFQTGQHDGKDQIYLQGNGQAYVLEGENLDLKDLKAGAANYTFEFLDGFTFEQATIIKIDDEIPGQKPSESKPVKSNVATAAAIALDISHVDKPTQKPAKSAAGLSAAAAYEITQVGKPAAAKPQDRQIKSPHLNLFKREPKP